MENIQKRPNAYATLFSFFKSKAVRNLVSAALLICSLFTMLIIDKKNYIRDDYFAFLNNQHITDFFKFFKIESFNVMFNAWVIFVALFVACFVLLVGNIFSGAVIKSMASKYGKKGSENKALKVLFGIVYYALLLLVAAVIVYVIFAVTKVNTITVESSGVLLNLLYVLLIVLAFVILLFVAILLAYTVFLIALAVLGFVVYQVASFAKALDTDGSVFGSKEVQVVTVTVPQEAKAIEEVKEEVVEEKTEESTETVEEITETTEEIIEETTEEKSEITEVSDEVIEETTEAIEEKSEVVEEETEQVVSDKAVITEEVIEETEEEKADDFKFSGNASRLKTSFLCRLIQAEKETADYYSQLKNYLLSYKGVNSRVSWFFDSFNKGRNHCAKLNIRGKTVIMYIALDPKDYSISKYHHTDVSDKAKYAKTPMMLRIRSARALKYATELIAIWMEKNGVKQTEVKDVDYSLPYETNEALLERGLIKKV